MTRKNKLLSIVVMAVLFVACVFGFTLTNKTAKADDVLPVVDASSIEGALYDGTSGCAYIASKKSTTDEWIIFEWTNGAQHALDNGSNSGYCYIGTKKGIQHGNPLGAPHLWTIYSAAFGENVKLYFNTKTGDVYKVVDGNQTKAGNLMIENPDELPLYACFCMHHAEGGGSSPILQNLKIYDSTGKNLLILSGLTSHVEAPVVDNVKAEGVDIEFPFGNFALYTDEFIYGEKFILEWTNGANVTPRFDGFAGGYRTTFIVADKNNESSLTSPDPATNEEYLSALYNLDLVLANRKFYEPEATIKVVVDMKNGGQPMIYSKADGATEFELLSILYSSSEFEDIDGAHTGEYKFSMWYNCTTEGKYNLYNVKAYNEYGEAFGIKLFNGKYTPKTVQFMDGETLYKEYTNAQPGRNYKQFEDLTAPAKENFVGWTLTPDGENFANSTTPVPSVVVDAENNQVPTKLYAKYADSIETELAGYKGLYVSDRNYFEITEEGEVISYNNVIPNGNLQVFVKGASKYVNLAGAIGFVNGDVINIDGVAYTKTTDVKTVKYYVEGKIEFELAIPSGMAAPDKKIQILAKTFHGWKLFETGAKGYFNFNTPIVNDINLVADITINYVEEDVYETVNYSYYNKVANEIYIFNSNKTYESNKDGEETSGIYKLVYEGTSTYAIFDEDVNKANNPVFLDNVSLKADKVYNKLNPDGYSVLVILDNGTEDKVYTANASTGYLLDLGDAVPTKTGYTFKGYKLGDDSVYDMNTIVTGALTLYAIWESDGTIEPIEAKTGISTLAVILIIVAGVVLVAGGAYVVLNLKKKPATDNVVEENEAENE